MLTVTKLAKACGLSRSTVLYYESVGLLKAPPRTQGNYRRYGEKDVERLKQICMYRNAGLTLTDVGALLDERGNDATDVLLRRLRELDGQIGTLRDHQRSILRLLNRSSQIRRTRNMTKDKWVEIMKAAGFQEAEMKRWHTVFEKTAPQDHEEFLRYLKIPEAEITKIRELSRKGA